jgi:hypothetical protein
MIETAQQRKEEGLYDTLRPVISTMDRILREESEHEGSKRATSDPLPCSSMEPRYLPAITEESNPSSQENLNWISLQGHDQQRAISDPTPSSSARRLEQNTIRIVPSEAVTPPTDVVRPLNIRKSSEGLSGLSLQRSHSGFYNTVRQTTHGYTNDDTTTPYDGKTEARDSGFIRYYPLVPIQEEEGSPKRKSNMRQSGDSKKWNIFKRITQNLDDVTPVPPLKDVKPLTTDRTRSSSGSSHSKRKSSGTASENSDRKSEKEAGKVNKFLRFFTKTKEPEKASLTLGSKYRVMSFLLTLN